MNLTATCDAEQLLAPGLKAVVREFDAADIGGGFRLPLPDSLLGTTFPRWWQCPFFFAHAFLREDTVTLMRSTRQANLRARLANSAGR